MKQILLLNGPNLNMLGQRDRHHYGTLTLQAIEALTAEAAKAHDMILLAYQSNHEGALIDKIQQQSVNCIGIIINPGALTHYSYALHDALLDSGLPVIEVHLSKIAEREPWRQHSVIEPACITQISGQKEQGYRLAVTKLIEYLSEERK